MENVSHTLKPGTLLKSRERTYEIVRILGCGGFGITYEAKSVVRVGNIDMPMRFAIKEHFISMSCYRGEDGTTVMTVPAAKANRKILLEDFINEANRLKSICLKSKSIVSVNEMFEANNTAYYVMEYLEGGPPKPCEEPEAIRIVLELSKALEQIHKERILHLDIKPDNIVMKTDDHGETYPVLIDFGGSKHFNYDNKPTTKPIAKGVSLGYAPQEQCLGMNEFSPKYDIYALGAVLYYLCTGENPPDAFSISSDQEGLKEKLAGRVSSYVERAILHAMTPQPEFRTPTVAEFCKDLMPDEKQGSEDISDSEKNKITESIPTQIVERQHSIPTQIVEKQQSTPTQIIEKPQSVPTRTVEQKQSASTVIIDSKKTQKIHDDRQDVIVTDVEKHKKFPKGILYALCGAVVIAAIILLIIFIPRENDSEPVVYDQEVVSEAEPEQQGMMPENIEEHSQQIEAPEKNQKEPEPKVEKIKEKPAQESEDNDSKFARARNDINLMLSLAQNNYAKAYAPLAEMYLKRDDYNNAHKWAVRALKSKTGTSQARKVVEILDSYDYYHNGEHGGKPEY